MDRRLFLLIFASLLLPLPVLAKDGADDTESGDNGDDNSGSDNSGDDGDDNNDEDDNGGDDGNRGHDDSDDSEDARHAVSEDDALPLKDVLAAFNERYSGSVVDVQLLRGNNALRYRIKFIDAEGKVRRAFFDAVSGAPVQ
jgi:uncharacterized membrane protein YkoI